MKKEIPFKVESFNKIPNPYTSQNVTAEMYTSICDVKNIPKDLLEWMDTNPRKQNINGKVGKKIQNSLLTGSEFHLLNRGLLLSAQAVNFNSSSKIMTVYFEDPEVHGDVDGGHTLKVIMENQDFLEKGKQYVKIEILTGVESFFEDLAEARNTSTQVKDESIANLKDHFSLIQEALENESFKNRVNYMENDDGDIEIGEILAILYMFNIDLYPAMDSCPVSGYSSKKKCIDTYLKYIEKIKNEELNVNENPYFKMVNIMPDIFKLYDQLEKNMGLYYAKKNPGGHYGSTTGVAVAKESKNGLKKTFHSKFSGSKILHSTPKGFLYPILGAFRALVVEENGKYTWGKTNPFEIMDKIGPELVTTTVERSRQNGNNPNKTGKDTTLWGPLYMRVMMEKMLVR